MLSTKQTYKSTIESGFPKVFPGIIRAVVDTSP